jgi:hypothetical protein
LLEEDAVIREHLYAVVLRIRDVHMAGFVDRDPQRLVELPRRASKGSPVRELRAVERVLVHTTAARTAFLDLEDMAERIERDVSAWADESVQVRAVVGEHLRAHGVGIGHEDAASGIDRDTGGSAEGADGEWRRAARDTADVLEERAVGGELLQRGLHGGAVEAQLFHEEMVCRVHRELVGSGDRTGIRAVGAPLAHHRAVGREDLDVQRRIYRDVGGASAIEGDAVRMRRAPDRDWNRRQRSRRHGSEHHEGEHRQEAFHGCDLRRVRTTRPTGSRLWCGASILLGSFYCIA